MAENVFGDSQFSLDSIGEAQRAQIAKSRAIIEQKEKGVDMAKTVGETKLFMSGHGIMNAIKPLKPRIKKLAGRKANEFKKTIKNKISDYVDGDGGKSRRLNEFKAEQDDLNEKGDFQSYRKRFGKLSDEDKDSIRENLKDNPEFSSTEDLESLGEASEKEAAMEKNTQLLRDQVSEKETNNFMENDASKVAEEESSSTLDNVKNAVSDVASRAKNVISDGFKSGDEALNTSTNVVNGAVDDAKAVLKTEAKKMAESELSSEAVGDTIAGLGSAALDSIPGADIIGAIMGAGIAIKKAIQVRRLEKKDENVIADAPVVGSLQQIL